MKRLFAVLAINCIFISASHAATDRDYLGDGPEKEFEIASIEKLKLPFVKERITRSFVFFLSELKTNAT